jgi:drug/metabolite transporter (DMT)-like permease
MSRTTTGTLLGTLTAVTWGGMFVIAKSALGRVDAFHLTMIRYFVASAILLALLRYVEGPASLRLDGRGVRLFVLGTLGFAGFNLLAFTGLAHAPAEGASLITAMAPLLTAVVLWLSRGIRPSRTTLGALVVALVGVALVISHGDPASLASTGWGDGLVLVGVLSFVIYTLGAAEFRDFSPLRYTALTASLGWLSIAGATIVATLGGLEPEPSAADVWAITPQLAYIALLGAVVAVASWNAAVVRLGPQNAALFSNLIPVTTFVVEIVRGYRPVALEFAGAAITVGALVASNLLSRPRRAAREAVREELVDGLELDAA